MLKNQFKNWYLRIASSEVKIAYRGNVPMISDEDEALSDPYDKKKDGPFNIMTPGDQSTNFLGKDYYRNQINEKMGKDHDPKENLDKWEDVVHPYGVVGVDDGNDPDKNDRKPTMEDGSNLYDTDSPIGRPQEVFEMLDKQQSPSDKLWAKKNHPSRANIFDNLSSRIF